MCQLHYIPKLVRWANSEDGKLVKVILKLSTYELSATKRFRKQGTGDYRKHATKHAHLTLIFYFLRWVP